MQLKDFSVSFPSDAEVIAEEVVAFRELSPRERAEAVRGLITAGAHLMRISPKSEFLEKYSVEMHNQSRQAVKEFIARHAR